jgi:hypothetical protein
VDDSAGFQPAQKYRLAEIHPSYHAIIERFQPYNRIAEGLSIGGGYFHSFRLLRDLNDTDKHRLLTPVLFPIRGVGGTEECHLIFNLGIQQDPQLMFKSRPIKLGAEVIGAILPRGVTIPDMEMAGYVAITIALPEGWAVQHVVERIAALTIKVIREFEPIF